MHKKTTNTPEHNDAYKKMHEHLKIIQGIPYRPNDKKKLKEETMVNKTRQIVDSLYEGNNDIRDTVDEIISEKAVSFLEALKIEVAQNIFNEGKTYKDRHDKDYGSDNKNKKKDDEYRNQRRKEKGAELEEEHSDEAEDKSLVKKMVKKDCLQQEESANEKRLKSPKVKDALKKGGDSFSKYLLNKSKKLEKKNPDGSPKNKPWVPKNLDTYKKKSK